MKDTSFHGENLRRRARYIAVFSGLVIAFAVTVVLNINTGNVHISVPKILRILFLRDGAATEYSIIWRIRLPRILMAAMLGGALSLSGFLLQTFFANPIAGPFVLGISSGANGRSTDDDHFFKIYWSFFIIYTDRGSVYRIADLDGVHSSDVKKSTSYGGTAGRGNHDRLYLFCYHRFCCHICR